jgi:hypothetical protein
MTTIKYILTKTLLEKILEICHYDEKFSIYDSCGSTFIVELEKQVTKVIERTFRKNTTETTTKTDDLMIIKHDDTHNVIQYVIYSEQERTLADDFIRELDKYFPNSEHEVFIKLRKYRL